MFNVTLLWAFIDTYLKFNLVKSLLTLFQNEKLISIHRLRYGTRRRRKVLVWMPELQRIWKHQLLYKLSP